MGSRAIKGFAADSGYNVCESPLRGCCLADHITLEVSVVGEDVVCTLRQGENHIEDPTIPE